MNRQKTWQTDTLKPYLVLLVILLLAYLPVSTFHFAMKNDAFSDNFPNKFFLTQSLRSGFFPLWNPYVNYGLPIYADPGFAFWSPVTWFFASVIGYNAYTLTLEVLLFIYISGIMAYRLGRYLDFGTTTAVTIGAMYMCSGFFTGELQHINFLTSAAFLPFLLKHFLNLFRNPDFKSAFLTSIALYLVFTGGHPAIPIACIYFLTFLSLSLFVCNKDFRNNQRRILQFAMVSVLVFIILFSPALYSYLTFLPEYGRGMPVDQADNGAINSGFSPSSYLSFLYPFATVKNASFFTDDLSMRNSYLSAAGFSLALTQLNNKRYEVRSLLVCGVAMALLSCGGYFKTFVYSNLPLLSYIKTNGEYRVFTILSLCIVAGYALNNLGRSGNNCYNRFEKIVKALVIINAAAACYVVIKNFTELSNSAIRLSAIGKTQIKEFIDGLTPTDVLLAGIILNTVCMIMLFLAKGNLKKFSLIVVADLIINSMLYLPFSGVGKVTLHEIQSIYNQSGNRISPPPLISINNIETLPEEKTGLVGSWTFYNKKIGTPKMTDYPSYFSSTENYFKSNLPATINNLPFVFLRKQVDSHHQRGYRDSQLHIPFFSPNRIRFVVNTPLEDSLILLQNHYRFWSAKVDGRVTMINKAFLTFMSVHLDKGVHMIEFSYEDPLLFLFIFISIPTLTIIVLLIYTRFGQRLLKLAESEKQGIKY